MVWLSYAIAAFSMTPKPFAVQFEQSLSGRNVTICLDGRQVETSFAGKMGFRDATHEWTSVCADVRSPVRQGQMFAVRSLSTQACGGKIAKAGNIVARYLKEAETPDQCAGLQLAVWKALEDGFPQPDFSQGRLQARASYSIMSWAQYYYQAVNTPGNAYYLQTPNGGNQGPPYSVDLQRLSGGQAYTGNITLNAQSQLTD